MNAHDHRTIDPMLDGTIDMDDPKIAARMESMTDEPLPSHLHAKVMKRVFLAGYGKYLVFSASILVVNVGVLAVDLYRAFTATKAIEALSALRHNFASTPAYFASAVHTLYSITPLQSVIATALTVTLATYIAVTFAKIYRNPAGIKVV